MISNNIKFYEEIAIPADSSARAVAFAMSNQKMWM